MQRHQSYRLDQSFPVCLGFLECLELPEYPEFLGNLLCLAHPVCLESLVTMPSHMREVFTTALVIPTTQGTHQHQGQSMRHGHQLQIEEPRELREPRETQVLKEPKEKRALKERRAFKVLVTHNCKEHKAYREFKELKVT